MSYLSLNKKFSLSNAGKINDQSIVERVIWLVVENQKPGHLKKGAVLVSCIGNLYKT